LVDRGEVLAARLDWPGRLAAGLVEDAILIARAAGSRRGTARFANGEEALVDQLPVDAQEGAPIRLKVTRSALAEAGRLKRAQARPTGDAPCPAPSPPGKIIPCFPAGLWEEVWGEAWDGSVDFAGGTLTISPTPAMTVIDIDGDLPARSLALAAVAPLAAGIRRLDLAGSIAIDFPTLADKADRQAVDTALAAALQGWPHERTAMNGFGLVHLVARLERPSLLHRLAMNRNRAAALMMLRRAEQVRDPGSQLLLTAHPDVRHAVIPEWETELARRAGRAIRWQDDTGLAPESGFAQALQS
jgi:hypothetical protein